MEGADPERLVRRRMPPLLAARPPRQDFCPARLAPAKPLSRGLMEKSLADSMTMTREELERLDGPSVRESLQLVRFYLCIRCPQRRAEALRELEILAIQDELARQA